jgi:hypothetical protein
VRYVTVHHDLVHRKVTLVPVDTLPEAPAGATHTWHDDGPFTIQEDTRFIWFTARLHDGDLARPSEEFHETYASVAHRLAAAAQYTGHLHLWILPMTDLGHVSYGAIPGEKEPDR